MNLIMQYALVLLGAEQARQVNNVELLQAIADGNVSEVKRRLKSGMKPDPSWLRVPARGRGSVATREKILALLVETKPDLKGHETILLDYVSRGSFNMVKMLLDYGVSADAAYVHEASQIPPSLSLDALPSRVPISPGHVSLRIIYPAVNKKRVDILRLLLERGASATSGCRWAGYRGSLESHYYQYPINIAAYQGSIECVKLLLKHGASINFQDERGQTPLYAAIVGKHSVNFVKQLLDLGADAKLRPKDGLSLADLAKRKKLPHVAKLLESQSK
jgi:hypothetical protein